MFTDHIPIADNGGVPRVAVRVHTGTTRVTARQCVRKKFNSRLVFYACASYPYRHLHVYASSSPCVPQLSSRKGATRKVQGSAVISLQNATGDGG